MKLIWLTDIHFDFLNKEGINQFLEKVQSTKPDAVLVGGDIGIAKHIKDYLQSLEVALQCPIYFVLGNHDYYGESIASVRLRIEKLSVKSMYLNYLPSVGSIELTPETCLVGHGCWGDAGYGDFINSKVMLRDYEVIQDLIHCDHEELQNKLNTLGDEASCYLEQVLQPALLRYENIFVLTHVPPFLESTWHQGHNSDNDWVPHFSCKAVGDMLLDLMSQHPEKNMTVFCGHTHSRGSAWLLPNLLIRTGAAIYGKPDITDVISV